MKVILIIQFLIMLYSSAYTEYRWKLVKDSEGISVFNRNVDGSELKEFRVEAVIDAPVEVIFEVMIDVSAGPLWMNRCIESELVKNIVKFTVSKNSFHSIDLVYNATGAPFPVSNRDFIVESDTIYDFKTGTINIKFHAVNDSSIPLRKGYVRMTDLTGSWSFKYIDPYHTKAVYQVKQNPGGSLPASMINYTGKSLPYNTIAGLRRIVTDNKYIESAKNRKK